MLVQVMPGVLIRATGIVTTGRIAAPASLPGADARPVSFTAKAMTVHDPKRTYERGGSASLMADVLDLWAVAKLIL
jgi:hypothetical protein